MSIYIQKTLELIESVVPMLHSSDAIREITHKCPHCDGPVKFPLVARQPDIEALAQLMIIAEKFLKGNGMSDKMLLDIKKQIKEYRQEKDRKE